MTHSQKTEDRALRRVDPAHRPPHEAGFSLIECMVALLVLTAGLLGLAQLFGLALHQAAYARNNSMLSAEAMERLEDLRSQYNYGLKAGAMPSNLSAGNHGPVTITLDGATGSNQGAVSFKISWTVTDGANKEKDLVVTAEAVSHKALENRTIRLTGHFAP